MPEVKRKNSLLTASYAGIAILWVSSQVVFIPYVPHLLVLVTCILYAACHASLVLLEEPRQDPATGETPKMERDVLKSEDAYQFPLWGSLSLFGLYLAFRFLDKDTVNLLIGFYFGAISLAAVTLTFSTSLEPFLPETASEPKLGWKYQLPHSLEFLLGPSPLDLSLECSLTDIVAFLAASVIVIAYFFSDKVWFLNNVLAVCFCLQGIERFSLGTYKIGAILLVGLFFYDIFWVFGTDVMVTVAKNVDGPIKILFPRDSLTVNPDTGKLDCSLLGLGDIVMPGFFLSLLLRFDAHRAKVSVHDVDPYEVFPKPYFYSGLIAYCLGLALTLLMMIQFNAAQPALLYLVPACLGSSFLCAAVRGEIKDLLDYSEELEDEEEDESKEETTGKEAAAETKKVK